MTVTTVTVSVNGDAQELAAGTTIAELVTRVAGSPKGIAVARNAEVVPRSAWDGTPIADGDRIELLTAAQGG